MDHISDRAHELQLTTLTYWTIATTSQRVEQGKRIEDDSIL